MDHKLTVTVPEEVYQPLVEEALRHDRTPEEEASLRLQRSVPRRNGERKPGALEELFGSVSLGHPTDMNNESIDRDIARTIADNHEDHD
ncbi:MAG TPA: hypothetical protein DC054_11955 [Blastocatellia bacterium]|nr:hypothetical protein [Blastocatellia bacterium]